MVDVAPFRRRTINELWRVQALAAAAGVLVTVKNVVPFNYSFISVVVRADSISPFDIMVQWLPNAAPAGFPTLGSTGPPFTITDIKTDGLRSQTSWVEARSDNLQVYIKNTDIAAHTYDAIIYGIG